MVKSTDYMEVLPLPLPIPQGRKAWTMYVYKEAAS